ncbi:hypothetical protein HPP92_003086 [Vanilla planifolia]|uniref:Pentatricopeptide repeat-containing protein n=1 Tax=Vanilla planifolia TaxID=51239 RepID=A0A835RTR8_VANPL|nr:hypothetical protein HPP92_003086 [Vanilla planifolia]
MVPAIFSLRRLFLASLLLLPPHSRRQVFQILFRSISSGQRSNAGLEWHVLLQPDRISSADQFRQLLCRSTTSGLSFQNPHLRIWNSLLYFLSSGPAPSLCLTLFDVIRSHRVAVDGYTLTSAFKATCRLELHAMGTELQSLAIRLGLECDTFVFNSLINMYFTCGFICEARRVFDLTPSSARDLVSWNTMVSGYFQNDLYEESLRIFWKMAENSIAMDSSTLVGALSSCAKIGSLNLGKKVHLLVITAGFGIDVYLGSCIINMYAKCGALDDARRLFDRMPDKNSVCWTAMISGNANSNQFGKAVELFREMLSVGVKPDDASISSVLSSCAQLGALNQGMYIHSYCDVNGIGMGLTVKNALIDMYSKCGDIERALFIFHELDKPDVFSWTTVILGLAMNGSSFQALEFFSNMEQSRAVVPNEITFLGVLTACSHGGLVWEGHHYFDQMRSVYKLLPRLEHYGCMVDLLGRANLLREAEKFIRKMPIEPDAVIWRSLLFACRVNEDVRMAEFAAQRIIELEPKKCGGHVMLSNVYAASLRWSDASRVRRKMNNWNIQKLPGCSFIELNGVIYEFLAANTLHYQEESMNEILNLISRHSSDY